jgi:hypothetical protein
MLPVDPLPPDASASLRRFRRLVMADPAAQAELSQLLAPAAFAEAAAAKAQALGVGLESATILQALRPDPLRLARLAPADACHAGWPDGDWLPTYVSGPPDGRVEWTHFAGAPLAEPFFDLSARAAEARPFNRLFRCSTRLDDFLAAAAREPARAPDGLIFHMSRCGSTLTAQMLQAMAGVAVVSEAPPIDAAVQLETASPQFEGALAAVVSALGRRRAAGECGFVLKLDSWHALALPLFRRTFPATPWVFLYRDPVEVLVSQMKRRGVQTIPGVSPGPIFGLDPTMPDDEYCACALALTCEAAAEHLALGDGLLVRYDELPRAVHTRILPHFGLEADAADRAAMEAAARRDAKAPEFDFAPDGETKRRTATPRMVELAGRHLAGPYERLEALRLSCSPPPPRG